MEFKQGDIVVYSTYGVCCIESVCEQTFNKTKEEYYVLKPCDNTSSTYYIPTHNSLATAKLRKIMTVSQLEAIFAAVARMDDNWIENEIQRKEFYQGLLSSGSYEEIICMIRTLHHHRNIIKDAGKKMHACDENFLKAAEQMVASEVSHILGIEQDKVGSYIKSKIKEK